LTFAGRVAPGPGCAASLGKRDASAIEGCEPELRFWEDPW
jgi:hypothetical protein